MNNQQEEYICTSCWHVDKLPIILLTSRCSCCRSIFIVPFEAMGGIVLPFKADKRAKLRILKGGRSE